MDKNKLVVLKKIGYKFRETCATCKHGCFPNNDFGTCSKHTYLHLKHKNKRQLSVNKNGWCPDYRKWDSIPSEEFFKHLE